MRPKIVLIIPYFGKWPIWFDAHLVSIEKNPTVDWLFFTDCDIPENAPANCTFITSSLNEIEAQVTLKTGVSVTIEKPYKLCDFKPAYGHVFEDYISEYDFWGFTDIDIIWGEISAFITQELLQSYDVINSRKRLIGGHFCIFKNTDTLKYLYKKDNVYEAAFEDAKMKRFCEDTFSTIVKNAMSDGLSVKMDTYFVNQKNGKAHQEYYLDRWLWSDGHVFALKNGTSFKEVMYLHFINWKKTMKLSEVNYTDAPNQFYISYNGIHYQPHSTWAHLQNSIKNLFNGYYAILNRKRFLKKLKKRLK